MESSTEAPSVGDLKHIELSNAISSINEVKDKMTRLLDKITQRDSVPPEEVACKRDDPSLSGLLTDGAERINEINAEMKSCLDSIYSNLF